MISLFKFWWRGRGCLVSAAVVLIVVLVGGLMAWFVHERFLTWVGGQLVYEDLLQPTEAVAVLAGGGFEREIEAADIYENDSTPLIVLTRMPEASGLIELQRRGVQAESNIEKRLRYLRELGVPEDAVIVLSETVVSTDREAELIVQWAQGRSLESLTVVTSKYHTARARFIFDHVLRGSGISLRIRSSRFKQFDPETWWLDRPTLREGIFEFQKLILYRLRYW